MVKWIVGLILALLVIDHLWVRYGGPVAERLRGEYGQELKKHAQEHGHTVVPTQQAYRKSIIEELVEKAKTKLKEEEGQKSDEEVVR
ncbi:MAG: hypothetical protein NZ560_06060 [Aquificaceae bacterium]|nr:hypothetical protein [Aquificaceae bacterium]MDW8096546.1 hypothetical protein [Aquificaceae bacterium]